VVFGFTSIEIFWIVFLWIRAVIRKLNVKRFSTYVLAESMLLIWGTYVSEYTALSCGTFEVATGDADELGETRDLGVGVGEGVAALETKVGNANRINVDATKPATNLPLIPNLLIDTHAS
jgi:hypothetical protein